MWGPTCISPLPVLLQMQQQAPLQLSQLMTSLPLAGSHVAVLIILQVFTLFVYFFLYAFITGCSQCVRWPDSVSLFLHSICGCAKVNFASTRCVGVQVERPSKDLIYVVYFTDKKSGLFL